MNEIPKSLQSNLAAFLLEREIGYSELVTLDREFPLAQRGLVTEQVNRGRMINDFIGEVTKRGPSLFHYLTHLCAIRYELNIEGFYAVAGDVHHWLCEAEEGTRRTLSKKKPSESGYNNAEPKPTSVTVIDPPLLSPDLENKEADFHNGWVFNQVRIHYGKTLEDLAAEPRFPVKGTRTVQRWISQGVPELKVNALANYFGISSRLFKTDGRTKEEILKEIENIDSQDY